MPNTISDELAIREVLSEADRIRGMGKELNDLGDRRERLRQWLAESRRPQPAGYSFCLAFDRMGKLTPVPVALGSEIVGEYIMSAIHSAELKSEAIRKRLKRLGEKQRRLAACQGTTYGPTSPLE